MSHELPDQSAIVPPLDEDQGFLVLTEEQARDIDSLVDDKAHTYYEAKVKVGVIAVKREAGEPEESVTAERPAPQTEPPAPRPQKRKPKGRWAKWGGRPPSAKELRIADSRPDLKPFPYGTAKDE